MSQTIFKELFDIWANVENEILQRPATNWNMGLLKIWRSISLPVHCNFSHLDYLGINCNSLENQNMFEKKFEKFAKEALNIYASFLIQDFKNINRLSFDLIGDKEMSLLEKKAVEIFGEMLQKNEDEKRWISNYVYLIGLTFGLNSLFNTMSFADYFKKTNLSQKQEIEQNTLEWKSQFNTQELPWETWQQLSSKYHFPVVLVNMEINTEQLRLTSQRLLFVCEKMKVLFPQNASLVSANNCSLNFVNSESFYGQYFSYSHQIQMTVANLKGVEHPDCEVFSTYIHEWMHAIDFASRGLAKSKQMDNRYAQIQPIVESLAHEVQHLKRDSHQAALWRTSFDEKNRQRWIKILHHWIETYGLIGEETAVTTSEMEQNFLKSLLTFGDDSEKRRAVERVINPLLKSPVPRNDISQVVSDVLKIKNDEKFLRKEWEKEQSFFSIGSKFNEYKRQNKLYNNANYTVSSSRKKEIYYTAVHEMLARSAEAVLPKIADLGYDSNKVVSGISAYPQGEEEKQLRPLFQQLIDSLNNAFAPPILLSENLGTKIQEKRQTKQIQNGLTPKP